VLAAARWLGTLRPAVPALRRGERRLLLGDADRLVVVRDEPEGGLGGGPAILVLSRGPSESTRVVAGLPEGAWRDVLSGRSLVVEGALTNVDFPPLSAALFVREGAAAASSSCLP